VDALFEAGRRCSWFYVKLYGFSGQFDKNIKSSNWFSTSAIGTSTLDTVATSEETINIDDVFEESPFCRRLLLVGGLKAKHCSDQ
jgi:hypothetical protein